jgi:hypothetical protein
MEIATYLGMNAEMLKQAWTNDPSKETKELMDNLRTATMEAQLIMYELARKQMQEEVNRNNNRFKDGDTE